MCSWVGGGVPTTLRDEIKNYVSIFKGFQQISYFYGFYVSNFY